MDLTEELMSQLNVDTAFTIPIGGGIPVSESVVITWGIMAVLVAASLLLTRNLKLHQISRRQALLEYALPFWSGFLPA